MKIDKPGIYLDFPSDAYFADPTPEPSLTQSIAKVLLDQSPLHAKHAHPRLTAADPDDEDGRQTAAQAIGNAAHKLLIGRGKEIATAPWSDWRSKEARAFRAEQAKQGRCPVLEKHVDEARVMSTAALLQLTWCGWDEAFREDAGHGEVVLVWQEHGLWFRTMIDWLSPDLCTAYDLKTGGGSFAPHVVGRAAVDAGWDIQAAFHERALDALDPDNAGRRKIRFVALENYLPYALLPVEMTEAWLTMGRKKLDHAIALWRECMASGQFHGYGSEIVRPDYPGWKESEWLTREAEHAERKPLRSVPPYDVLMAG